MPNAPEDDRYIVQERVEQIGESGQQRLASCRAAVVGVGALGSTISQLLVRGGVGFVRLIDGDRVDLTNLHRQLIYTEEDVARGRNKAGIAAERLTAANSGVAVEAVTQRLTEDNGAHLLADVDVVVDGTDNLRTRYLINELCLGAGIPWVYGGISAVHGLVMPVLVGSGPCLRCVFPGGPPDVEEPTSESAGVFGPTPAVIAALESTLAIRILIDDLAPPISLLSINVWTGEVDRLEVKRTPDCPTCGDGSEL